MRVKKIVPCLDVKDGIVVKGVKFRDHEIIGDIVPLAKRYQEEGADELVFYDITASIDGRTVDKDWVRKVSDVINIPFCVAGGIRSVLDAKILFEYGADKISINSPALENPQLITELAEAFGSDKIVVGVDSFFDAEKNDYFVYQYTGDSEKTLETKWRTLDWVKKAVDNGAGEIVLNMMNQDGVRDGYDIAQLQKVKEICKVPLIASGGAGKMEHFKEAFLLADVEGALSASAFHKQLVNIAELKNYLKEQNIKVM